MAYGNEGAWPRNVGIGTKADIEAVTLKDKAAMK